MDEPLQRASVTVPGGELPCWVGGTGTDVVVVHGGPDVGSTYLHRPLLETLGGCARLHFYDQRDAGRSPDFTPADSTSLPERLVLDLELVRERFDLDAPVIAAHSFGGLVAIDYALRFPARIGGLLLIDPDPPTHASWEMGRRAVAARRAPEDAHWLAEEGARLREADPDAFYRVAFRPYFVDPTLADALDLGLERDPAARPSPLGPAVRAELGEWDLRSPLGGIRAPTLVVTGSSSVFPRSSLEEYAVAMPDCRMEVIDAAGHFPHMEQPDRFRELVEPFLKGWSGGA